MGRTRLAKASIAQLKVHIKQAHERKRHLQEYLKNLDRAHSEKKISYAQYVETLHKKTDGRNLHELIHYYDHHIKECERLIRKHKQHIRVGRAPAYIIGILIILALMFFMSPQKFKFTGFFIDEGENITAETNITIPDNITITEEPIPSENITLPENITSPENVTQNITPQENITIPENATLPETNITLPIQNITPEIIPNITSSENTTAVQDLAILNQPVKWIKAIKPEKTGRTRIEIPKDAQNIKLRKLSDGSEKKLSPSQSGPSPQVEADVVSNEDYELEYETSAPYSTEENLSNGKRVIITSPDTIHYTNVLAFTNLSESLNVQNPSRVKIRWVEQNTFITPDKISDTDGNGIYDYIEWLVPSLSNQTFEIIVITKAEHLDSNRNFISDIYEQVKSLDNLWSEAIPNQDYVRVTFETNLTSSKDITIFPRKVQGNPKVEVYEENGNTKIAEFSSINDNQYNKVLLTNLQGAQDVFDLKIQGGSVEFDHIVDPTEWFENCADISEWTLAPAGGWAAGAGTCTSTNTADDNMTISTDLTGKTTATLIFDWTNSKLDSGEWFYVYAGTSSSSLSIIFSIQGNGGTQSNTGESVDITSYISSTTTITFRCLAPDGGETCDIDNMNLTTTSPDNPPQWYSNSSNNTNPLPGAEVSHNVNWTDGTDLDFAILQVNSSGVNCDTFENVTTSVISGTSAWANLSWQIPEACEGKTIEWKQFANDSSNQWNITSLQYYTVQNVNPTANFWTNPVNNFNSSSSSVSFELYCTDNLLINQTQLWGNFTGTWHANQTNSTPVNNSVWTVSVSGISDGNYVWAAWCNDTRGNFDYADTNRTLKVDATGPSLSNANANVSTINQNSLFCLNITASDVLSSVSRVYAQLVNTTATANYTMTETGGACSGTSSDGIYGVELNATAAGLWNYTVAFANDSLNNWGTLDFADITINVTAPANTAPQVTQVYNNTMTSVVSGPNEGPTLTPVQINFTAYDAEGFTDINMSSAYINFSLAGETPRSASCTNVVNFSTTYSNFTCNVSMYWYDGSGTWSINASVKDVGSLLGQNSSQNFFLGETIGMTMFPTSLSWASIIQGATNQEPNENFTINNTGNDQLYLEVNATNLKGEQVSTLALWAGNFTAKNAAGCEGTALVDHAFTNITSATLPKGNFTQNLRNETSGQEQLFICLEQAGSELTAQSYSTTNEGAWTIRIVLVALSTRLTRRKKKIEKDRVFQAMILIKQEQREDYSKGKETILQSLITEIKTKYRITRKEINILTGEEKRMIPVSIFTNKLGALESLVRYMKENLGMNYAEIAFKLGRDERTIWTAYNKSIEKQKVPLTIKEENKLPLELFESKELTILEALIIGLKEKGLKYSEIAVLIERDERNIGATYSRAMKNKQ